MNKPRVEMLPLIDIVFLVLVVFIYAMLSMAVHRGLPVDLPASAAVRIDQGSLNLAITVRVDGEIFVDREPVSLERLAALLREKSGEADPGVLLFADRGLSYQRLFAVLDQVNRAGISRVSLQAEAGREP